MTMTMILFTFALSYWNVDRIVTLVSFHVAIAGPKLTETAPSPLNLQSFSNQTRAEFPPSLKGITNQTTTQVPVVA